MPGVSAVYHVSQTAQNASDDNPGSLAAPLKTISGAVGKLQPGDSIFVGDGTYRESVVWKPEPWEDTDIRCTLAAEPGSRPVIKGSDVIVGPWEPVEIRDGAAVPAPAKGHRGVFACPLDTYAQMVFVDEEPLQQIGLQGSPLRAEKATGFRYVRQWVGRGLADMRAGSFHYDNEAKRLYVWLPDGASPDGRTVEVAVRDVGIDLRGTWTVSGLDVRHVKDGMWPREQAVNVSGNRCIVESCRITHNDFLGLIVSGEDCTIRDCEIAYNGMCGMVSNWGFRMLVEGNEFHHNAWRGDVVCLSAGNKWVMWRDSRFIGNHFHDEEEAALWMDINVNNVLVADNLFEDCPVGVYFEISRWGVIVNNTFRRCGRGVWIYSSDALVAHNVLEGCGEGITVTGMPRVCNYNQSVKEPGEYALMPVRNVQVLNNIIADSPGSFVGITEDNGHSWGNWSDYNVFVWTLPYYHRTGSHFKFMRGWDSFYGKLAIWRMERHCDTHSLTVDPKLRRVMLGDRHWVALPLEQVLDDGGFVDAAAGDYRLQPDSPLRGKGIEIPLELEQTCIPCDGTEIKSRAWGRTLLSKAPREGMPAMFDDAHGGHYRLPPIPGSVPPVNLDACGPGTPGINEFWRATGQYPHFRPTGEPESPGELDWQVRPEPISADPGFDKPFAKPGEEGGPWIAVGALHTYTGVACANLNKGHTAAQTAYQKIGAVRPDTEYVVLCEMHGLSLAPDCGALGEVYLAAGDERDRIGSEIEVSIAPGGTAHWGTRVLRFRTGPEGQDPAVGKPLSVVISARAIVPDGSPAADPVALLRWDNLRVLSGATP